jgi:hypothetical protein
MTPSLPTVSHGLATVVCDEIESNRTLDGQDVGTKQVNLVIIFRLMLYGVSALSGR